jgi:hypothetical protein
MHSYYSLVVKLLTSELLAVSVNGPSVCHALATAATPDDFYSILQGLENSEHYRQFRISNFLEGDFFSWYVNERSQALVHAIRELANALLDFEPATAYLAPGRVKDLLKEFYSSLVDEQVRHDLGEYYTPDWLAQHLLDRAGYVGNPEESVLDPACGSGTFLVECILRLKSKCAAAGMSPAKTLQTILKRIKGLDLNPLAVISSRANYILSISDLVFSLGHDIELPVYLADSINIPVERQDSKNVPYLEYTLDTEVANYVIKIPVSLVKAQVLGRILLYCEDCIVQGKSVDFFMRAIAKDVDIVPVLIESTLDYLSAFYKTIESLEQRDWDKIWCRILKNNFSPKGFEAFDLIIGNPPWVRWSRLPETYRNRVKAFCNYYGLVSGRGYSGGIESDISTVITYSAADNWLKIGGRIGFLITWTVFKTDSAKGFRLSRLPENAGLRILLIEDLTSIQPFPDAANQTAVYLAKKVGNHRSALWDQVPCYTWKPRSGFVRLPPAATLAEIKSLVDIVPGFACPVGSWGSPLFTGDRGCYNDSVFLKGKSPYLDEARRGTVTDCSRIYWVKILKYAPETGRALIRTLTEDELTRARPVSPVTGAWVEAELLHPLVRGRDTGRYCFETEGWYQLIPNRHYEQVEPEEEFADRYPLAYSYLKNYEDILLDRSTHKRYQPHLPFYVIYCVGDYSFAKYKVAWMEQQNPASFRACVLSSDNDSLIPNRVIVPDHKLYFVAFDSAEESHYLCGFLNARPVRTWLGGFLLGKNIGTTIFEYMNVPRYDPAKEECKSIAEISHSQQRHRGLCNNSGFADGGVEDQLESLVKSLCK